MRSALLLALGIGCGFSAHGNGGVDGGGLVDTPILADGPVASGDAPVGADASSPDAAMPPPPPPPATCGAPQAMPDDFDTEADWATQGASATGDTVTLGGYDNKSYVFAVPTVSLVSAAATVDVQSSTGSAGVTAFFAAWPDGSGNDAVGFEARGSNLVVGSWPFGGSAATATAAFDGSAMAFWQISESAGTLSFATSPDGSAWSAPIYTVPTPSWAAYGHLVLETTGSASYTGTYAALDGSNAGSAMPWCDTDTFHGAPSADSIATWWSTSTTNDATCTFGGSGYVTAASGNNCFFQTSSRYNLVDSSFVVHWGSDTDPAAQPAVVLAGATTTQYLYALDGEYLCDFSSGACVAHTFSAAGLDAYWRIAEYSEGHEIQLSISADGSAWVPMLLVPESFAPAAIEIGAGTTLAGSAHVLGVN